MKKKNNTGFIFVHLILAVFLLASLLCSFQIWIAQYERQVKKSLKIFEKKIHHRSLIYRAMALLSKADVSKKIEDVSESSIHLQWEDESEKFDLKELNHPDQDQREQYSRWIEKLFKKLQIPSSKIHAIFEEIHSHENLESLEEIPSLRTLMKEKDLDLSAYLTVYSQGGKININTAPKLVLEVLLEDEDPFLVERVLKKRRSGISPYHSTEELSGLSTSVLKWLTFKGSYFRIRIFDQNFKEPRMDVVLERAFGTVKVRQWIEK
ncbi:MAG: general secretion pathway protein GspK [Chlamydiae bacterium]|nr:general secretion pathway protein GspK [Chlamydiota bacterium]MBI3278189.1 general secretion pathway protein GspK [Chlamydiota bacterium]